MSRKIPSLCVALLLTLSSAYAAQRTLNSISELYNYVPQPTNILELLHWFANRVNIDNYGNTWVTFNPDSDYGSHHYGNYEGLLDPPAWGYKYYTFGNILKALGRLPSYVADARRGSNGWNRARIIFSSTEVNGRWDIQRVYITQHYGTSVSNDTSYDSQHTYAITTNLLREFRGRSILEIQRAATLSQRSNYGNTSPHLQGFSYSNQYNYVPQSSLRTSDENNFLTTACLALLVCFVLVVIIILSNAKV